jgi:hypothetical protein
MLTVSLIFALLLAGLLEGAGAKPVDRAMRIAACGADEVDRAYLDQHIRSAAYDQLGGGFHDFPGGPKGLEKNAWYLNAVVAAHEAKPDLFLRNMALDTVGFVLRDLKDAAGGFFASIGNREASSYYAFTEQEIHAALGREKSREFFATFALTPGGFPRLTGSPFAALAETRQTLLLRRLRRVRLPLDETIDPSANGLWVGALARAAATLQRHDFMEAARRAGAAVARFPRGGGAGAAFGLVSLERFDAAHSPEASSKALDYAIERSPSMPANDLMPLAWSLAETIRLHDSDVRRRQLTSVLRVLESRFAATEAAAAARCVAATVLVKSP